MPLACSSWAGAWVSEKRKSAEEHGSDWDRTQLILHLFTLFSFLLLLSFSLTVARSNGRLASTDFGFSCLILGIPLLTWVSRPPQTSSPTLLTILTTSCSSGFCSLFPPILNLLQRSLEWDLGSIPFLSFWDSRRWFDSSFRFELRLFCNPNSLLRNHSSLHLSSRLLTKVRFSPVLPFRSRIAKSRPKLDANNWPNQPSRQGLPRWSLRLP